jgi:hypothetical protein
MKEHEISMTCSIYGEVTKRIQDFGWKPEGKRPLRMPKRRWEINGSYKSGVEGCRLDSPGVR